ncbi:type VI secretion system baseplate subunit TssG [Vibrio paucivorans]|uniref:Type VI secretion system baseplate subunit TssG n=1 Tax=Vibrio paucivorans TaxID=2829489 RepID=A0A9X3CC29_9VIBR|nr:type VI secretion system baseplate subunit TssG [Vibrio paucivorans]MCW8332973.1 type VI secretion system baseplate subunit TssG [Vibrio paucivorans]
MSFIHDMSSQPEKYDFVQAMRLLNSLVKANPRHVKVELKAEVMPTGAPNEIQYFSFKNSKAKIRLAKQALSGVKGVIPNYIYEELLIALHKEDHALKDFLDVFNQRHFELVNKADSQRWLLLENELSPEKTRLLNQLSALKSSHGRYFQYSMLLGHKTRHIGTLKQMLNDYFPYRIDVECNPSEKRQLPADSLTRLGNNEEYNCRIGQGFLLGKHCEAQFNHISIYIVPSSRTQFTQAQQDEQLGREVLQLAEHFIRDNTPISIYLSVKRTYLNQPVLSSDSKQAARLGEVDCLSPERKPNEIVRILIN